MDAIELIAKSSGQVSAVTGNGPLSLSQPSVVKIAAAPEDVQSLSRNGDHLLVRLKTGKVITVENFFQGVDGVPNDLVLQAPDGQLWQAGYEEPWDGMELTRLDSVDELLALQSDDHNVAFGLLVPAAGLGAIGVGNMLTQGDGGGSPRSLPPPAGEAPGAPLILFNRQQGLTGTAEPGSLITLTRTDGSTETTTTNSDGTWSFLPNPLEDGQSGSVTASNGNGTSPAVDTGPADLTPPQDPVVSENNASGLSGTGEAGDTIILTRPDGSTVTTVVDQNGNWSFPDNPLEHDESGLLEAVDPAGNSSGQTPTGPADLLPPEPPAVTENNDNGLAGTGEPGGIVTVDLPGGGAVTTVVDGDGNWVFPENPLAPGEEGTVTVTDPAGNISGETPTGPAGPKEPVDPTDPLPAPVIEWVRDDQPPLVADLQSGSSTNDRSPTVGGSGVPGGLLTLYLDERAVASVTVGEDGKWEIAIADLGADGVKRFTAEQSVGAQTSPQSEVMEIVLDTLAPGRPLIEDVYDGFGADQGTIPNGGRTDDFTPVVSGRIEGEDIDYVKLYDKGMFVGTAVVDAAGLWTFDTIQLGYGPHGLQVSAVDEAGNEGPLSAIWNLSILTPPSINPDIRSITDDFGSETGFVQKGESMDDRQPVVKGRGRPGDTLELYMQLEAGDLDMATAFLVGTTTIDPDGYWTLECEDVFQFGGYGAKYFYASSYDGDGNRPVATKDFGFVLVEPEGDIGRFFSLPLEPLQQAQSLAVSEQAGGLISRLLSQYTGGNDDGPAAAPGLQARDGGIDFAGLLDGALPAGGEGLRSLGDEQADAAVRAPFLDTLDTFGPIERSDLLGLLHSQQLVL